MSGTSKAWVAGVLVALLVALVGTSVWWLADDDPVRYDSAAQVELPIPLPPVRGAAGDDQGVLPATVPAQRRLGPAPPDPALIEAGTFGPMPRIGPGGQRALFRYARPFDLDHTRPWIAILVTGLGLQAATTETALQLPAPISLEFSPYGTDLEAAFERARAVGHEVFLDLPMEPPDYPDSDPGPHTLLADAATADNLKRLDWLLARAAGYVAVAGSGIEFALSAQAPPMLQVLVERGLGLIEIGSDALALVAQGVDLPYASAPSPIDEDPSVLAIDYALAALEAEAAATGSALAVVQAYPVSLERIRLWAGTLDDKELTLAPASAYLIHRAGLAHLRQGEAVEPSAPPGG